MFDEEIDRAASRSSRWRGKDVLALTVGDTDFRIAEPIRAALEKRLAHGVLGYDTLSDEVYEQFISRAQQRYDWKLQQSWITSAARRCAGSESCLSRGDRPWPVHHY